MTVLFSKPYWRLPRMAALVTIHRPASCSSHRPQVTAHARRLTTKQSTKTHDTRTLQALADDAAFRPRFKAAPTSSRATQRFRARTNTGVHAETPTVTADLPVATIAIAGARPRAKRTSTMRTVRISVPSRKRQHAKLRGGARVDRAVHALERAKLTKLTLERAAVNK